MTLKVLYVEDNPYNMRLVSKMLKAMNYHLLEAEDGASGIHLAMLYKPDVILMDLNLPDMSGIEVIHHIKADSTLAHIPIIAITADESENSYRYCIEAGCTSFLAKPIYRNLLLKTIAEAVRPTSLQ